MKNSTIAIILNEAKDAFLMGYHQRGEGKGKLNFIGGKVADKPEFAHETPEESIRREIVEESGLTPLSILHCADVVYTYPESLNQRSEIMKVYRVEAYTGELKEDPDEFKLTWVNSNDLPHDQMWESDRIWLPQVMNANEQVPKIEFFFDSDGELIR